MDVSQICRLCHLYIRCVPIIQFFVINYLICIQLKKKSFVVPVISYYPAQMELG